MTTSYYSYSDYSFMFPDQGEKEMVKKAREIASPGNHARKKGQKSARVSKSKAKKPKEKPKSKTKKLYVYYSKDDGTFSAWHEKLSSQIFLDYWTLLYEVTIRNVGGPTTDIVGRIAQGIEFGNGAERFAPL